MGHSVSVYACSTKPGILLLCKYWLNENEAQICMYLQAIHHVAVSNLAYESLGLFCMYNILCCHFNISFFSTLT